MENIYQFQARLSNGEPISLSKFQGKALLIVNTASQCGFTPQYEELQSLYNEYKDQGLEILAFPCNQFGSQESSEDSEIKKFCDLKFNIKFQLFAKINVNGPEEHPLFKYLKSNLKGFIGTKAIKWNFTKFLVDKNGIPVKRFAPQVSPIKIVPDIKKLLSP